jgi:hypothetical protein
VSGTDLTGSNGNKQSEGSAKVDVRKMVILNVALALGIGGGVLVWIPVRHRKGTPWGHQKGDNQ